jgi:hypothetical protein
LTDEQIEKLIDHAIPDLRVALKAILREHKIYHAFDFGIGTNSITGIKSKVVLILACEPVGVLLEKCGEGVRAMEDCILRLQAQAKVKP